MHNDQLTEQEKIELRQAFEKKAPFLKNLTLEIETIEEYYTEKFERIDKQIKEELVNDHTISDQDLIGEYVKRLETAKKKLLAKAIEKFGLVKEKYEQVLEQQ